MTGRWRGSLMGALFASGAWAGVPPAGVSPGGIDGIVLAGSACPTMSWAGVEAAAGYTLVVYEVSKDGQLGEPVLEKELPGGVGSWTLPANACLRPGTTYAWSVAAVDGDGQPAWSEPLLFQIEELPGAAELRHALAVIERHLAGSRAAGPQRADPDLRESAAAASAPLGGPGVAAPPSPTPPLGSAGDNLAVTGDFLYTSPRAAKLKVSGETFIDRLKNEDEITTRENGYARISDGLGVLTALWVAPISLPQGAQVNAWQCHFFDGEQFEGFFGSVKILRKSTSELSSVPLATMQIPLLGLIGNSVLNLIGPIPDGGIPAIDNSSNAYLIEVDYNVTSLSPALQFHGCTLEYTVPGLAP